MGKYINTEKVWAEINRLASIVTNAENNDDMGEVSDGYHTFNELYYYRMLYNAAFFNLLPKEWVHKSKRHHSGEECFDGGWFIVTANLPTGQISNHYELKYWDLFKIEERPYADEWDGHTPQVAAERLKKYIDGVAITHKFEVGDLVRSKNNPRLTYKILEAGSINERGNADYKVEIFVDGEPGISVLKREHNINRLECQKMDVWGELIERK